MEAAAKVEGGASSIDALEIMRIESGIPKFGVDMDETNLASEAGIEARAIATAKAVTLARRLSRVSGLSGRSPGRCAGCGCPVSYRGCLRKGTGCFMMGRKWVT
jgi:hypothetical protein